MLRKPVLMPAAALRKSGHALNALDVIVVASVVAGFAFRVWILSSSNLGSLDSDEAVWGLMARHLLHGQWSVFFWNQSYGGTIEAVLTAGLFGVVGSSTVALKLVPAFLYAIAALLLWRVGRRIVGEPSARVAAALFWIWPAYFVWRSTKAYGFYSSGLVLGLAVMLLALRLAERDDRRDFIVLGLALGLGWWTTPQILILDVPAVLWLVWRRPGVARGWILAGPAAVVGALPWIIANVRHDGYSLHSTQVGASSSAQLLPHLHNLFSSNLPTTFGLRVPFSLSWVVGPIAGWALYGLLLGTIAWVLFRRANSLALLPLTCLVFLILYAVSAYTWLTNEPRYLTLFLPGVALLFSAALRGPRLAAAGLVAAGALSIAGLATMERQHLMLISTDGVRFPADFNPLIRVLEQEHVHAAFANYWVAYRLGFESREQIVVSSSQQLRYTRVDGRLVPDDIHSRYAPWDVLVRRSPNAADVFVQGAVERQARHRLMRAGYSRVEAGGFVIYVPPVDSAAAAGHRPSLGDRP